MTAADAPLSVSVLPASVKPSVAKSRPLEAVTGSVIVTVPGVPEKTAVLSGLQATTPLPSFQVWPAADQVPPPPAATPSAIHRSVVCPGVNTRSSPRESPASATRNEPPCSELPNPPVPFAAAVTTLNCAGSKPLMAEAAFTIRHEPAAVGSKSATGPLTSGPVEASDQRLSVNRLAASSPESVSESAEIRSHCEPAVPCVETICQL